VGRELIVNNRKGTVLRYHTNVPGDLEFLREEIIRLGPWHYDVQVTPDISTRVYLEAPPGTYPKRTFGAITFLEPRDRFKSELLRLYPHGLEGRTMMDCACNCGGYLFWAREAGAGQCLGFDAREHWIEQAIFLREQRGESADDVQFEVCDLYDVPKLGLEPFDITLYQGIFHHVPDPISGLKIAADLTKELLIIGTATRSGMPDGCLFAYEESDRLMSGKYGHGWRATGPEVLDRMLRWVGFVETRVIGWLKETPSEGEGWGRLRMAASKSPGLLERLGEPRIVERQD
jgi:tRNA (mo5U34)-methyltransferase